MALVCTSSCLGRPLGVYAREMIVEIMEVGRSRPSSIPGTARMGGARKRTRPKNNARLEIVIRPHHQQYWS